MKRTVLLALLLACGTAQAAEWVGAAESTDQKTRDYIDIRSSRPNHFRQACRDAGYEWAVR